MSAPTLGARTAPPAPPAPRPVTVPEPGPARAPWLSAVASGLAVLLAAAPVSAVVQGSGWLVGAAVAVAAVVAVGLVATVLLPRHPGLVALLQLAGLLAALTLRHSDDGVLGALPGAAALGDMAALLAGAGAQIDAGVAPVAGTPEILFLVSAAAGLLAIAVHLAAVGAQAPAAGGVPLLAAFAVPAALADDLLPWWTVAAAALAFGLLLLAPDGNRRQLPGGAALVAAGTAVALLVGLGGAAVGTAGRYDPAGTGGGGSGAIGLSPFTALRGQLEQGTPTDLFTVRGLTTPTYLRALTLAEYRAGAGWQAVRPEPGVDAAGALPPVAGAGEVLDVTFTNEGFRDYWLPLYGLPVATAGLDAGTWAYDPASGTAYSEQPAEQGTWTQRALLPGPTADELRAASGTGDPGALYSSVSGVDPRVIALAQELTAGAGTPFDRALALQEHFTGPDSGFVYDLRTAPPAGDDALVEFLTVGRTGYCEQFASAMAVMLRAVGVPARVAVGFTAGRPEGDARRITTSDAHAWVEAFFPGIGWTTFDPTPLTDGRALVPPYVQEARDGGGEAAPDPQAAPPVPTQAPPTVDPVAPRAQQDGGAVAAPVAPTGGFPVGPLLAALLVVALLLTPLAWRAAARRSRTATARAGGTGAAGAAWAELLAESTDRGVPVPPTDTVRAAARRLVREHRLDAQAQDGLRTVVTAVEADWYGGQPPEPGRLAEPLAVVRAAVAAGSPLRWDQRLLPPSLRSALRSGLRSGLRRGRADGGATAPEDENAAATRS